MLVKNLIRLGTFDYLITGRLGLLYFPKMKKRYYVNFNKHFNLEGRHAFLSPSGYHWIRYDDAKLEERFFNSLVAKRGTELHKLAHDLIRLGVKLPGSKKTMNQYVNDAIGYRMTPEQSLYYSDNCFGTTDAIAFRKNMLRIFDLKTGETKSSIDQLQVYAALFCLEYKFKPFDIKYDLRIYQLDEVQMFDVDPVDIAYIMDRIQTFDRMINEMRMEGEL